MSATIITMADFQAAAEQAQQAAQYLRRPVSVIVHWSESAAWENEQVVPFAEFEEKAAAVALAYVGGGYLKTKITVQFDDGESYGCRVDLAAHDEFGFADHCLAMLAFYETEKGRDYYVATASEDMIAFIQSIDFGTGAAATNAVLRNAGKAAEQAEAPRQESARQAVIEARQLAREQADRLTEEWRAALVIPADTKAVIVARLVSRNEDRSDPYADYYQLQNDKVIILAWSKHTRDLFSEMRKAANNHPDTAFLSDPAQSQENREKYSMGKGYYLTDRGFISTGWIIEKVRLWSDNNPARWVPCGEMAIPGYQVPALLAKMVDPVTESAEAVAPVKPKFTALQAGGVWSVSIQQGEQLHQFDNIEADTLAEACKIAWALLTQTTPPDDDPSGGQPLPVEPVAEQPEQTEEGAEAPP